MLCSTSIVIIKQKPQQVLTYNERCGQLKQILPKHHSAEWGDS